MSFSQLLHQYFRALDCTAAELAAASELSKSMISRYLSGDRLPSVQGKSLQRLAHGIAVLSRRTPGERFEEEEVYRQLYLALSGIEIDYEIFVDNLNLLVTTLELSNSELARALNFDPSYISRILAGQRRPGDLPKFLMDVSQYVARRYSESIDIASIAELTGCTVAEAENPDRCAVEVCRFLGSSGLRREDPVQGFLSKLDSFDLDEYSRAIPFDDLKLPTAPFQFPRARNYRGLEDMMQAELDFLRLTLMSRSREDVFFFSDMPLEQMSRDELFLRRWIYGVAMMLKKGLRLQVIHDVNRPLGEMLVGLESWIPLYMTGQIAPFYLKHRTSDPFLHQLRVSGAAALFGEAIAGHHTEGRYYLTNAREEQLYFRNESRLILKKALPLMDIYTHRRQQEFQRNRAEWMQEGKQRMIYSSMPLFCAMPETLRAILSRAKVSEEESQVILKEAERARWEMLALLRRARVELELPLVTEAEFETHPVTLSLSELFLSRDVVCTYGEYQALMGQAENFAFLNPALGLRKDGAAAFRNVNITVAEEKLALVSKSKSPTIHFVIRHPRIVEALYRFVPPLRCRGEE